MEKVEIAGVEPLSKNYNQNAFILVGIGIFHAFVCFFGSIIIAKEKLSLLILVWNHFKFKIIKF